jgi:nucleotide-binding universal stress UspA family protein
MKRIVLPLDGSPVAESVLPVVADLARAGGASVRLLRVMPLPNNCEDADGRVIAYADQEMERLEAEARDYLRTVETRLGGLPIESCVRFGDPLHEILKEADAFGADLIAVTTAGRSGVGRAVLGSVAERVFRKAGTPVLLYRPRPAELT